MLIAGISSSSSSSSISICRGTLGGGRGLLLNEGVCLLPWAGIIGVADIEGLGAFSATIGLEAGTEAVAGGTNGVNGAGTIVRG